MRPPARRSDDSDVIRARLRALLAEGQRGSGWVPDTDEPDELPGEDDDWPADEDDRTTQPVEPVHLPAGLGRHRAPGRAARVDPGRPGAWALWTVAVVAAVVVVGWTWIGRPVVDQVPAAASSGAPAASVTAPSPASAGPAPAGDGPEGAGTGTVVVSVVGLVGAPGLVTLPAGARVADALAAAGGLLPEADPASVNAAAVVSDGQQIAVGVPGAVQGTGGPEAAGAAGAVLDLNTATVAELDALPGIGPVLAQRIVDHRSAHGPFTSVDRLDDVSGIGPAIFAELAERVRV
ncbi:ComEA family DNA-binding protein [Modestobacter sp. VKM Ac-2982]|uniref:ComEA family DNA-binding protein n=1 Tax=Modestobacter sp. VKM Ac-2982 TaxID=3004136 RepID=UPI0022AB6AEF|nr:ComEA family DNA-binding protein [Modestobacter sp. VKM Ac-2982]MCZ2824544.1 ComEA family DNA-binding protein [Modestobacter sp. VKM Ac-2981]